MPSVLASKQHRKPRRSNPIDPHAFESLGEILRRMRWGVEAQMSPVFSESLSMALDQLIDEEQRLAEKQEA